MRTYRPKPSQGFIWLWAFSLLMLAGVVPTVVAVPLVSLAMFALMLLFMAMGWWFPTIRYELSPERLVLRFGPFSWTIPIAEIETVTKRTLRPSLWSNMRLPGFAMFTVTYADEGNVLMCSTRAIEDILLIVTADRKYGITPSEEDEFLAQLRAYMARR